MINDVAFAAGSSSVVYACSDEFGVYRSGDGGVTWAKANQGLPSTKTWSLALHPKDPKVLGYLWARGGGVYKSTDGGRAGVVIRRDARPDANDRPSYDRRRRSKTLIT